MRISISIPDSEFAAAERLADRLRLTRSEFYASAVRAFLEAHRRAQSGETAPGEVVERVRPEKLRQRDW